MRKMRPARARRDSAADSDGAIDGDIHVAAAVMARTVQRRGRAAWPSDQIVDPRLIAIETAGRFKKPGLAIALDAMERLRKRDGLPVLTAARVVARKMVNWWSFFASDTERRQLEYLQSRTSSDERTNVIEVIARALNTAHYNRKRRR